MKNPLSEHPWLLAVFAFVVLTGVWLTVMNLSGRINTRNLTPAEEIELLQRRAAP